MENEQINDINISLETIEQALNNLNTDESGTQILAGLMQMPDEQFAVLSESTLKEFERLFNDPSQIAMMVGVMNTDGITVDQLRQHYDEICEEIDNNFKGKFSQIKIDFMKRLIGIISKTLEESNGLSKRVIQIPIQLISEDARIPQYARIGDAGMDIYALEDVTIKPGETKLVKTGIKCAIPNGYELQIRPRSGLSLKTPLRIANAPGTIDSGYRGEIGVLVTNIDSPIKNIEQEPVWNSNHTKIEYFQVSAIEYGQSYTITKGMKFAQMVLTEIPTAAFFKVENIDKFESDRGAGGFGSTGFN